MVVEAGKRVCSAVLRRLRSGCTYPKATGDTTYSRPSRCTTVETFRRALRACWARLRTVISFGLHTSSATLGRLFTSSDSLASKVGVARARSTRSLKALHLYPANHMLPLIRESYWITFRGIWTRLSYIFLKAGSGSCGSLMVAW